MNVHIGTSGWHYRHWLGLFYPAGTRQKKWFEIYARRFSTVELNNPFYHLPPAETFAGWSRQAPPGFVFTVKASRYITHNKKLHDAGPSLRLFMDHAAHLGRKLGPVLFQLPPSMGYNADRLEEFLSLLPRSRGKTRGWVFEFRNSSWYRDETFALLEKYRVAFCMHDMPGSKTPDRVTNDLAYIRFHGSEAKYGGDYPDSAMEAWAGKINGWAAEGRRVFCYFNNDTGGFAPKNAATLHRLVLNGQAGTSGS